MKNKNLLFSLGVLAFAIGCFWSSFTSATSFKLDIEKFRSATEDVKNIVPVHFADNGNDFGGFLYLSDWDSIVYDDDWETVEVPDEDTWDIYYITLNSSETPVLECKRQIRWFYYNAERGERLWPLDKETWKDIQTDLSTEGWIYTICRKAWYQSALAECENITPQCPAEDPDCDDPVQDNESCVADVEERYPRNDGYYGQVKHVYKGQTFGLVIWTEYTDKTQHGEVWYNILKAENGIDVELGETFIRHRWIFPLGFVYDYNGWLWFAGCQIKPDVENKDNALKLLLQNRNEEDRNIIFGPNGKGGLKVNDNTFKNLVDCENIWTAADSLLKLIIEWLIGMNRESDLWYIWTQDDTKMQYFSSSDINNATLLNYVKQRSEILCRWKWDKVDANDSVVCLTTASSSDDVNADAYTGKTLIVKGRNVIVNPGSNSSDESYYDMFINGGDLLINEIGYPEYVFTKQWFIAKNGDNSDVSVSDFKEELRKFENGTYTWKKEDWTTVDWAWAGSFIRWNFVVDGRVKGKTNAKLNNKYFIYWKFTTKDSFNDLENTFAWRCRNGYVINKAWKIQDNQWRFCPPSVLKREGGEATYEWYNPYEWASLVVIDQNYNSPLYW